MHDMQTADFVRSFGTQPIIFDVPQVPIGKPAKINVEELLDAKFRALLLSRSLTTGFTWARHSPTDIRTESATANLTTAHSQYSVKTFSVGDHIIVNIVGILSKGPETAPTLIGESVSSVIGIATSTDALIDDDMLPELVEALSNVYASYTFRDAESVGSFLHSNPFIAPVLLDAHRNIAARFEDNTPLVLEVFSDPDEPGSDQLFLFIQTSLPSEQARERLRQLDREWWLSVVPTVHNKLTIDVESV